MGVKLAELGPTSMWQRGPGFLLLPRGRWPVSALVAGEAPKEELRKHRLDAWKDLQAADRRQGQVEGMAAADLGRRPEAANRAAGTDVSGASFWKGVNLAGRQEASLLEMARESLRNATSWITATPREREAARKLQLLASSATAREALEKGKLLSLGAQLKGREGQGTLVVDGRLKRADMARLLGIKELVLIIPSEQLALLVMTDGHREDHRQLAQDIIVRARRYIWIPRGGPLARAVEKDCAYLIGHCHC